jgi:hypothetical protein
MPSSPSPHGQHPAAFSLSKILSKLESTNAQTLYDLRICRATTRPTEIAFYHPVSAPNSDDGYTYAACSNADFHSLLLKSAKHYSSILLPLAKGLEEGEQPTVGMLGGGISLAYMVSVQALMALG